VWSTAPSSSTLDFCTPFRSRSRTCTETAETYQRHRQAQRRREHRLQSWEVARGSGQVQRMLRGNSSLSLSVSARLLFTILLVSALENLREKVKVVKYAPPSYQIVLPPSSNLNDMTTRWPTRKPRSSYLQTHSKRYAQGQGSSYTKKNSMRLSPTSSPPFSRRKQRDQRPMQTCEP